MNFDLPALPYLTSAFAPFISEETMRFHHEEHEGGYLVRLRDLLEGTPEAELTLEQIVANHQRRLDDEGVLALHSGDSIRRSMAIVDNGLQVLNHEFFWRSMRPLSAARSDVGDYSFGLALEAEFGSYELFAKAFEEEALSVDAFGSSWLWLVVESEPHRPNRLKIMATSNAERPSGHRTPLLVCDLWEHAYYIDYRNERRMFVRAFLERLANWDFAEQNLRNAH